MPLTVIGVGLGRTGTKSLKLALEQLGLGPCHHMREVFQHPRLLRYWQDAVAGRPVNWEEVFVGYRSTADWPSTHFWRELARPTRRRRSSSRSGPMGLGGPASREPSLCCCNGHAISDPHVRGVLAMSTALLVDRAMSGRPLDETTALAVYRRHISEVKAEIAPERLLVFDVAEGWAPLCGFLRLPVPDAPFPRTNSGEEFWDPASRGGRLGRSSRLI